MRRVEVTPYNEQWVRLYEEEAKELRRIFGEQLVAIHHIGSTSVPGLDAKPIIDIMPVVRDISLVDEYKSRDTSGTSRRVRSGYLDEGTFRRVETIERIMCMFSNLGASY